MGAFKINPGFIPTLLDKIEGAFAGQVGEYVVAQMKENTPVGEDQPRKRAGKRRKTATEREVKVTYMSGTANKIFAIGGYKHFNAGSDSDQRLAYTLLKASYESRFGITGKSERIRDPLAGLTMIRFEPSTARGLTSAMSGSIARGKFMKAGNIRFKDNESGMGGQIFAKFSKPRQHGTLRNSIEILDVSQSGLKVSLAVGNNAEMAPYGYYVEYGKGLGKRKLAKSAGFMRRTLDQLAPEITDGSLIQGVLPRG